MAQLHIERPLYHELIKDRMCNGFSFLLSSQKQEQFEGEEFRTAIEKRIE